MGKTGNIFEFDAYKPWLSSSLEMRRGMKMELAQVLRIHTSLISQILGGKKNLTEEQALATADFLGLEERETEYLLLLLRKERAGNRRYQAYCEKQIHACRAQAMEPRERVHSARQLSAENKAEFYSHWHFSAVRLLTSLDAPQTAEEIANRLQLPLRTVREVLRFLVDIQLCTQAEGRLRMGVNRTHEPPDSPYALRHHLNWRLKAMETLPSPGKRLFAFTSPFTASPKDEFEFRKTASDFIARFSEQIDKSPAEKLYCLNVDWFEV